MRHDLGQSTRPEQEAIIATLRTDARLSLDDITGVMRRCLSPALSRSAIWRCLNRLGLGGPLVPEFAFVAIEPVTRFAQVEILPDRAAATVAVAMQRFLRAFAHPVHTLPTRFRRWQAIACRATG